SRSARSTASRASTARPTTPRPRPACTASPSPWRARTPGWASPSIPFPPATWPPTWSWRCRRKSAPRSWPTSPPAAWAGPRKSPTRSVSWSPRRPPGSPAPTWTSTAATTWAGSPSRGRAAVACAAAVRHARATLKTRVSALDGCHPHHQEVPEPPAVRHRNLQLHHHRGRAPADPGRRVLRGPRRQERRGPDPFGPAADHRRAGAGRRADAVHPAAEPDHPLLRRLAAGLHGQLPGAQHAAVPRTAADLPPADGEPAGADAVAGDEPAHRAQPGTVAGVPARPGRQPRPPTHAP